jgi:hypothetical protein
MGVLLWYASGFLRMVELNLVGQLGVLAGAIVAVVGSIIALLGKGIP